MRLGPFIHPTAWGAIGGFPSVRRGWTLVEMAGVVAVLGILAGLSIPSLQDLSRREQRDAEIRQVLRLAEAFRSEVRRSGRVPDEGDALRFMAAGSGLSESVVRINPGGQPRLLFRDPALRLIPNTETDGAPVGWSEVRNVRFLLLSSVGDPLREEDLAAGRFEGLWGLQPGQVPEGWGGRPEDLVVARIDLGPEFVELGWDVIDLPAGSIQLEDAPPVIGGVGRFRSRILKGSRVTLLDPRGVPVVREVVDTAVLYRMERGDWNRAGLWTHEPARPSAEDFARLTDAFLALPTDRSPVPVLPERIWAVFARCSSVVGRSRSEVSQGLGEEGILVLGELREALHGLGETP